MMNWKDNVDKDFAKFGTELDEALEAPESKANHKMVLEYLESIRGRRILTTSFEPANGKILEVGERNTLTKKIENAFNCTVDSTDGDLDVAFTAPDNNYMTIVMSHVIEHLFNPLFCLLELYKLMVDCGQLIILTPWCSENLKLRFTDGHYHEIDEKRMGKLLDRAGFVIETKLYYDRPGGGFHGVRPFIRKLIGKNAIYHCVKKGI